MAKIKRGSASTDTAASATKASDVTKDNYLAKALDFGRTAMIFRETQMFQTEHGLVKRLGMPRQWAAWRAYFSRLKAPLAFFDQRKYHTVPAEWPHEFDAGWTEADSIAAADWVEQREAKRIPAGRLFDAERQADAMDRKAFAMRMKRTAREFLDVGDQKPRREPKIDVAALFEEHDKAMAEAAAKRAAKEADLTQAHKRA